MTVFIKAHPGRQKPRWGFHPEEMNAGNGDRHGSQPGCGEAIGPSRKRLHPGLQGPREGVVLAECKAT